MRTASSVFGLTTFSTSVYGYIPAHDSIGISHATSSAVPLAIASSPCASDMSSSISAPRLRTEGGYATTTVFVTIPSPSTGSESVTSYSTLSKQVWSPSNSFYVAPPSGPSSSSPVLSASSPDLVAPSSSAPVYWSPTSISVPEYSIVPLSATSSKDNWLPSNSFYVSPPPPASSVPQFTPSVKISYTSTPLAALSRTPVIPAPVSTLLAVAFSQVQSQPYVPGIIPSSTPGVVPSYTPGVLPSLTPGIVPSPQSNVPTTTRSATLSQAPSFVLSLGSPVPSTSDLPITQTSSVSPLFSRALSSLASELFSASSSLTRVASPITPSRSSQVSTFASTSATTSPTRSTLSTTTVSATPSVNSQGTSIPPAPSAGGSSGSLSTRGKERVWWVAFLVPLIAMA
ncbi:hypothetical protein IQ06DRAFT_341029 [Phaeosphaeriaceae sp. SRC1lsM3a]|nr:hypothetical protein IQ06DRAFT_341029 [Stagonospora sp. SRC1lsM3a]